MKLVTCSDNSVQCGKIIFNSFAEIVTVQAQRYLAVVEFLSLFSGVLSKYAWVFSFEFELICPIRHSWHLQLLFEKHKQYYVIKVLGVHV